jgi:hypothetical protein
MTAAIGPMRIHCFAVQFHVNCRSTGAETIDAYHTDGKRGLSWFIYGS